uniref:Uncharacterized protein n=1 Tax=Arcella intermedia TaxID=1963864 RepID=A0A6B2LBV8_9EUKA
MPIPNNPNPMLRHINTSRIIKNPRLIKLEPTSHINSRSQRHLSKSSCNIILSSRDIDHSLHLHHHLLSISKTRRAILPSVGIGSVSLQSKVRCIGNGLIHPSPVASVIAVDRGRGAVDNLLHGEDLQRVPRNGPSPFNGRSGCKIRRRPALILVRDRRHRSLLPPIHSLRDTLRPLARGGWLRGSFVEISVDLVFEFLEGEICKLVDGKSGLRVELGV